MLLHQQDAGSYAFLSLMLFKKNQITKLYVHNVRLIYFLKWPFAKLLANSFDCSCVACLLFATGMK